MLLIFTVWEWTKFECGITLSVYIIMWWTSEMQMVSLFGFLVHCKFMFQFHLMFMGLWVKAMWITIYIINAKEFFILFIYLVFAWLYWHTFLTISSVFDMLLLTVVRLFCGPLVIKCLVNAAFVMKVTDTEVISFIRLSCSQIIISRSFPFRVKVVINMWVSCLLCN